MRMVIFDDEDMEPITVVNLRGLTDRAIEDKHRVILLACPLPPMLVASAEWTQPAFHPIKTVEIRFEQFVRKGMMHWFAFTRQADLAMLLTPDWLPGQRAAVQEIERQRDRLVAFIMGAMS